MKRCAFSVLFAILFGAAALPLFAHSFAGYLREGTVNEQLAGHSYYVAMGEVSLYRVGFLGSQAATGQTVESAVAVRVDKTTGRVERIVTLQPNTYGTTVSGASAPENTATVAGTPQYVIGDLIGGITVADIEPYGTWLDALRAMKQAITELRAVGQFPAPGQQDLTGSQVPPVVVGQPQVVVQQPVIVPPPIYEQPPEFYQPPPIFPPPAYVQQPPFVAPPPVYVQQQPPVIVRPPLRIPPPFQGGPPAVMRPPFDGGGLPAVREPPFGGGGSSAARQPWIPERVAPPNDFGRR